MSAPNRVRTKRIGRSVCTYTFKQCTCATERRALAVYINVYMRKYVHTKTYVEPQCLRFQSGPGVTAEAAKRKLHQVGLSGFLKPPQNRTERNRSMSGVPLNPKP